MSQAGDREAAGPGYVFEDRDEEERRLIAQAGLFAPSTERAFREAGLARGMRVLDLGTGAGDVAMLAARLVGPEGSVVGVERDAEAVTRTRRRVVAEGLGNVTVVEGDVQTLDAVEGPFDAVVGRLILMYLPNHVAALRRAAGLLRPGGVVCVQEADLAYAWALPGSALWDQVRGWFLETLARAGIPAQLGLGLYRSFVAAGLPGPELRLEAVMKGGPEAFAWGWANLVRGALPAMERLGVTTAAEVGIETLADRLLAAVTDRDGAVIGPPLVAAWSRVPS